MRLNKGRPAGLGLMMSAVVLALLSSATSLVWAFPKESVSQSNKIYDWKPLQKNNFFMAITNNGILSQVKGGSNSYGFWPAPALDVNGDPQGTPMNYVYGWGLWIGAQVRSTTPGKTRDTLCTIGYNPNNGAGEYTPGRVIDGVPQNTTESDVKIFSSLESGWPLGITVVSMEDTRCTYNDYDKANHATGGKPLKVEVTQSTFQWSYPTNQDIIFFQFEVKNTGADTLFDVYLAPTTDCDIGNEAGSAANDICFFDSTTNMAYQFQTKNSESGWTRSPGCVGFMFLESPIANKAYTSPDGKFNLAIGDTIGLFAFKVFNINIDPPTDLAQYKELAGYNYQTGEFKRFDPKPSAGDQRFMESTGPINLAPDSTAKTIVAVIAANYNYKSGIPDTIAIADLRAKALTAKAIYTAKWLLPAPPPAPVVTITASHKRNIIGWLSNAEDEFDPNNKNLQYWNLVAHDSSNISNYNPNFKTNIFQGYKLYKSEDGSSWSMLAQWDKDDRYVIDSLGIHVTGPESCKTAIKTLQLDLTYTYWPLTDKVLITDSLIYAWKDTAYFKDVTFSTDTRGSNSGLQHSYTDDNLINGRTYYYSVKAYGFNWESILSSNKDTVKSKKPVYFETSFSQNTTTGMPHSEPNEYVAPEAVVTSNAGHSYNYSQKMTLTVDLPRAVKNGSFRQEWGEVTRSKVMNKFGKYYPVLAYWVINQQTGDTVSIDDKKVQSVSMISDTARGNANIYWYKSIKYNTGNYVSVANEIVARPTNPNGPGFDVIKSVVTPTNPTDTATAALNISTSDLAWAFRTGAVEIYWYDHNPEIDGSPVRTDTLWPQVWHVVDEASNVRVKIPFDSMSTGTWTKSSWNIGGSNTGKGKNFVSTVWPSAGLSFMNIHGVKLYFNRGSTVSRLMTWANRPTTGSHWVLTATGSTVPTEGEYQVITTTEYKLDIAKASLSKIRVVPNPYIARNLWELTNTRSKLQFINLPSKCTIRIYTIAGNLIKVLDHDDAGGANGGTCWWDPMLTMNQQNIASGVYIYYVDAPGIGTQVGKFAVVR